MTEFEDLEALTDTRYPAKDDAMDKSTLAQIEEILLANYLPYDIREWSFLETLRAFKITPKQALSLLRGTGCVMSVEPTEAEIECVARAVCRIRGEEPNEPLIYHGKDAVLWELKKDIARAASKAMRDAAKGER